MISKNVNLRVQDGGVKAVLNEKIIIYTDDKGIQVNIRLQNIPYQFNERRRDILDENVTVVATVKKPDESKLDMDLPIEGGAIKFTIDETMTDELKEVGEYKVQLHLYDDATKTNRITLPPFPFTVKLRLGEELA